MRKFTMGIIAVLCLIALIATRPASADDSVSSTNAKPATASASAKAPAAKPSSPSSSTFNWSGVYIGVSAGYNWAKADTDFAPRPTAAQFVNLLPQTLDLRPRGIFGGIQMGYNHQHGRMVLGIVGDISGTSSRAGVMITPIPQNNGTPFPGAGFESAYSDTKAIATIRGRLGFTWHSRMLLYGTGGLAFGRVFEGADVNFQPVGTTDYLAKLDKIKMGIAVGGGGEFAVARHWTLGAEYLFINLGNETNITNPVPALPPFQVAYTWQAKSQIARGFVNYKF